MDPIDPNDVHAEANTLLRTMKLVRILQKKAGAPISRKFFEIGVDLRKGFG
jgi:hypothetical protein